MSRFWKIFKAFFLIGVIINAGAAMTASLAGDALPLSDSVGAQLTPSHLALKTWYRSRPRDFHNPATIYLIRPTPFGWTQVVAAPAPRSDGGLAWDVLRSVEGGWPFPCLRGRRWIRGATHSASTGRPMITWHIVVPAIPIWRGLMLNVALLVLLPTLLIEIPLMMYDGVRAITRAWGLQPGHCPECRYDLHGAPGEGCPECGWGRADQGSL
jgi:hypothetical protein